MITKIKNKLITAYKVYKAKSILKRKNFFPNNSFLILSDPRGGSTWLTEVLLNSIPKTYVLWEPLAVRYVDEVEKLNFGWRQHIPKNAEWKEANTLFDKILSGKIINKWTIQKTSINDLRRATLQITKICRGNDLLPWLVEQFDFEYKPIYLIRHPFAVVASQLKHGGWDYNYEGFQIPKMRYNDKYLKHEKFLSSLSTKSEALIATWCLSNLHDFNDSNKWISIFYEDFLIDPEKSLTGIFKQWHLPLPSNLVELVLRKSSTNVDYFDEHKVDYQLGKWKVFFSNEDLIKMQNVLDHFGVNYYSVKSTSPIKNNVNR